MAVVTKYGFVETAKLMAGETATAWDAMALGEGSAAPGTDQSTLETEITGTGLVRVEGTDVDTITVASSATADDTSKFVHTWTATGTKEVTECGVFNSDTADKGDMLCYGTFSGPISMESDDTLKVTWSVREFCAALKRNLYRITGLIQGRLNLLLRQANPELSSAFGLINVQRLYTPHPSGMVR